MNNEIGRKITSLTLMTIMVAGGMTFAVPGVMPAAHAANANLFVSAENSQFNNYFGGPMVIEVVINDPDIKDTDELKGEPDVTVNGKILRMVQATDGLWYAYFADRERAAFADATVSDTLTGTTVGDTVAGNGLDFGSLCDRTEVAFDIDAEALFSDTQGFYTTDSACDGAGGDELMNVVREAKTPSDPTGDLLNIGQIGLSAIDVWPIVQVYDLNPTGNVVVQYNKGGSPQTVTLTFDTLDGTLDASLDRDSYPQGAALHATLTDQALNIDPTDEDSWTFNTDPDTPAIHYQLFDESGIAVGLDCADTSACLADEIDMADEIFSPDVTGSLDDFMFEDGGVFTIDVDAQGTGTDVLEFQSNSDHDFDAFDLTAAAATGFNAPVTLVELGPNSGVFANYDELDTANIVITSDALRGTSATLDWDDTGYTAVVGFDFASIDIQPVDDTWNSGEAIPVVLMDQDANKNSRFDEDLDLNNPGVELIPSMQIGTPLMLDSFDSTSAELAIDGDLDVDATVDAFSNRMIITNEDATDLEGDADAADDVVVPTTITLADLNEFAGIADGGEFSGFVVINWDVRSIFDASEASSYDLILRDTAATEEVIIAGATDGQGELLLDNDNLNADDTVADLTDTLVAGQLDWVIRLNDEDALADAMADDPRLLDAGEQFPIVIDVFSFGFTDDGEDPAERVDNMIVRFELEENGDNTGEFIGEIEYIMLNQLNILDADTYDGIGTIADDPIIIVSQDFTDEDSLRVNYNDEGADGVTTPVADQQEAPTHSGVVSFDLDSYKVADTVTITLEDQDLNVDSDLREIYTVVSDDGDPADNAVGTAGLGNDGLGVLLNVTFDDEIWAEQTHTFDGVACPVFDTFDDGLADTGFTLVETTIDSGVFEGDFQIPDFYCSRSNGGVMATTTGTDIEVNYIDYRDASGEIIEVGDGAGVRANTGSISLDRTVYPVPFGVPDDFAFDTSSSPNGRALFPVHVTGVTDDLTDDEFLPNGDLTIHVRVNDPDFDISASGSDFINRDVAGSADEEGPVKISVIRGSEEVTIAYAGGDTPQDGKIGTADSTPGDVRHLGPIAETAPDSGIFELDLALRYTDGPSDDRCPETEVYGLLGADVAGTGADDRFHDADADDDYCILQGDILQVEYTDPEDASGDVNTVTDSATFDLRNGVLQTDKSVYIIGGDMIMTLIEPDFDLENDEAETYNLDLIEWDSDAATITMGDLGGEAAAFDPEPTDFRETGDSTGIFQIVIEIPEELDGDRLERGEEIILEYTDWGPSGSDFVGEEDEDVNVTIYTSNFGATVELDQKVYSWTDKVFVTIVAPDHNFDSDLVDEIGNTDTDPIKISTRGHDLDNYKLVETGTDTGIFTGEVILVGFEHDADGDASTGDASGFDKGSQDTSPNGSGPTDGFLETDDDDGITVSFEFSEDETVVGSALIRWNIGEVQWLEASYPASGTGVVRVIDPDMNLDPEAVDNFDVDVWSDSDAGGIDLTVTETNEATGIFEGTVFFTTFDESSGHRLRVAEGDTVTAEYEDNTLPDPYTTADELDITATSLIGTVVPPLERAPAANLRTVDAFGNSLDTVSVDQQVQISADLANGQDREQSFAYLVQIQDGNGVTVSLAWITGSLASGQSFSPALSWIPTEAGTYTATAFVWESVDNPTALSPPVSTTVTVN